jgi:hypothetical protein
MEENTKKKKGPGTGLAGWKPKKIEGPAREDRERQPRIEGDFKSMTFRLRKPAWAKLGKTAIDIDRRVQGIVEHGLNLVFLELGLPLLIEDDPMMTTTEGKKAAARELKAKAPAPAAPPVEEPPPAAEPEPDEPDEEPEGVFDPVTGEPLQHIA